VFELTTKRAQTGINVYYTPVLKLTDTIVKLSDDDIVLMKKFQEIVETENSAIYNKYSNAAKKKLNDTEKETLAALTKPLDADFEEIKKGVPFDDALPDALQPVMAG
jgi:hypothetical protein